MIGSIIALAMTPFDPAFALGYMLPFAEAAYDVAAGKTPLMPPGYAVRSTIKADPQRIAAVMAAVPLPHQRMVRTMVANNPIMGFVGRNDATQTMIVSFRGTETPEDWLRDFDSLAVPFGDDHLDLDPDHLWRIYCVDEP